MKKALFGNNIAIDCSYCNNLVENGGENVCRKNKKIKKGKCSKFDYNPTLRVPRSEAVMMRFSKEDFEL